MLAGKSPFDIVGASDNPDCNTEDFLFQGLCVMEEKVDGSVLKFSIDLQTCKCKVYFTDMNQFLSLEFSAFKFSFTII